MPSIVGIAIDMKTDRIMSYVGNLGDVRKWAAELSDPHTSIQIREIGEIVMYVGEVKS
jgi:hypothetical protein